MTVDGKSLTGSLVFVRRDHISYQSDQDFTDVSAVWDGILCQFFGFAIVGLIMAINGRAGSVYHVRYLY